MKNRQDFIKIIYKLKILSFNLLIKIAIKTHLENNTNNKIKLKINCNQKLWVRFKKYLSSSLETHYYRVNLIHLLQSPKKIISNRITNYPKIS